MWHSAVLLSKATHSRKSFHLKCSLLATAFYRRLYTCGQTLADHRFFGQAEITCTLRLKSGILECSEKAQHADIVSHWSVLDSKDSLSSNLWYANLCFWLYKRKATFNLLRRARTLLPRQPGGVCFTPPPHFVYILVIHSVQYRWDLLYEKRDICVVQVCRPVLQACLYL